MILQADEPNDTASLARLLAASAAEALRHPEGHAFLRWFREAAPALAPDLAAVVAQDEMARNATLALLGRFIWNRMPLPSNRFRPRPLPKPERNAACPCGSGRKYKHCCAEAEAFPDPFERTSLLPYVLMQYPRSRLDEVPIEYLDLEELAFVGEEWIDGGRAEEAAVLLERVFSDLSRRDARAAHAFDVLADVYDALGTPKKKERLIDRVLEAPDPTLRSAALHRRITMLADRGEHDEVWRLFGQAQRMQPDNPDLGLLEVTLLIGQGDLERARERGQFWIARLSRDREYDHGQMIETLRQMVDDPYASALKWEGERDPGVIELHRLLSSMPPAERHYTVEPGDGGARLRPDASLSEMIERIGKRFEEDVAEIGNPDADSGRADRRSLFETGPLATEPLAWHSFEVLHALSVNAQLAAFLGSEQLLLLPILRRAHELARLHLDAAPAELRALPSRHPENRPMLDLLVMLFWQLRDMRQHDEAAALGEWIVGTLDPEDPEGFGEAVIRCQLERGDAQAALALCDRFPSDPRASIRFDRVLALYLLGRVDEATTALRETIVRSPVCWRMLIGHDPKRPRIDEGRYRIGGADEAWLYREAAMQSWQACGALDWARSVAPASKQRGTRGGAGARATGSGYKPSDSRRARSQRPTRRLQLKVTLRDIEPEIWRRFVVAEDLTFAELHRLLQAGFGWEDCHLHEFSVGKTRIGRPDHDDFLGPNDQPTLDERRETLAARLGDQGAFAYWYDFGDDWWHDIVVEEVLDADAGAPRATLVAGERACPPEDCGGPPGYFDLVRVLSDPTDEEHAQMQEWAGDFDPERLDLAKAARAVARAAGRSSRK